MAEYNGWTIKSFYGRNPWLIIGYFGPTRKTVIEHFEETWGKGAWKKEYRKRGLRIVKVKLIEME